MDIYSLLGIDPEDFQAQIEGTLAGRSPAGLSPMAASQIIPVGRGSGLSMKGTDTNKGSVQRIETSVAFPDPTQVQGIIDQYYATPQMQAQRARLDSMRQAIENRLGQGNADYASALSHLANYWTGGEFAIIEPDRSKAAKDAAMLGILQKGEEDYANSGTRFLNAIKGGTIQQKEGSEVGSTLIKGAEDPSLAARRGQMPNDARAIRDVQRTFTKATEPFSKALNYANQAENLIYSESAAKRLTKKTIETLLARARGEVGNLSQYEQAGTVSAQDAMDRLSQFYETLTSGELTDANKEAVKALIKEYKNAANANLSVLRDVHAKQGAAAYGSLGLTEDRFRQALPSVDTNPPKTNRSMAPKKDYSKMSLKELEAEAARRGVK